MAAGQRVNPIPARTVYMPLEHPVMVISPYFRAQYPVDLNIIGEKDFTVVDVNGTIIFKLKSKSLSVHGRRKLMDASGNVLLSMSQKVMTAHRRWKLYRGDSNCKEENDDDMLFSVRESSMLQSKTKLDVFLAGNTEEKVPDFRVEGRFGRGSCDVYLVKTDKIIAQVYRSHEADKYDNFKMRIYPNVDYAFIFSLVVVSLKEMSVSRMYQASSHAMQPVRGSTDVLEMFLKLTS